MQSVFLEEYGSTIEFPEDFSGDQIRNAIEKEIIPQLKKQQDEQRAAAERKRKDETGIFEAFGTGLSRGIDQTQALLGDALPAIAADIVGADDYRDRQLQEYQESMAEIERTSPSAVPTFRDIDTAGDAALYASETIGQFIPSILTSIAGGGLGGFVGKKAAESFAKKMVGDAAEKAVKRGTTAGFLSGTFIGSGSQTIPEAYTSIAEETGEPNAAAGLIVGSINASLDSILPAGIAASLTREVREGVARNLFSRLMIQGGKGAAVEGVTEGTQEFTQALAANIINDNPEFFTKENVDRILEAGIRGAIGGKAFGLASGIRGESPGQRTRREQAEERSQLEQDVQTVRTDIEQGGQEVIDRSVPDPDVPLLTGPDDSPMAQFMDTTASTTIDGGPPVELSGNQLIELAEERRDTHPLIPVILDQESNPQRKAARLRALFREIYTGPEYIGETSRFTTGQPDPAEQERIARENMGGASKGGGKAPKMAFLPEEGSPRRDVELQPIKSGFVVQTTGSGGVESTQQISAQEAAALQEELKANPNPRVKVFEVDSAPGFTDPIAIAQTSPILVGEKGFDAFEKKGTGRLPRIPDSLTAAERAAIPAVEARIEELRQIDDARAKSSADMLQSQLDRRVNQNLPIGGKTTLDQLVEANNPTLERLKDRAEYRRAALAGEAIELEESNFETLLSNKNTPEANQEAVASAKKLPAVEEILAEAKEVHQRLNNEINREGFRLADVSGMTTAKSGSRVRKLKEGMSELAGSSSRLVGGAEAFQKEYKRGNRERVEADIALVRDSINEVKELLPDAPAPAPAPAAPAAPAAAEFSVKTQKPRLPDGSIDEMRGPVTVISDGTNTQYIARVSDPNNNFAWYRTDEKGDPPSGSGGIPAQPFAYNKKEAVAEIKTEMAAGNPAKLQQLVDDGTITEEQALEKIDPAQASAAVGAPQTAAQAPQAQQERITPEQRQEALQRIEQRLAALSNSGPQGQLIARHIGERITNKDYTVSQVATMFEAGEVINDILPQSAQDAVGFAQTLIAPDGVSEASGGEPGGRIAGLNVSRNADAMGGLIALALDLDPNMVRSTAAHEAFHTLQQYYAKYDQGSEAILNDFFGEPGKTVEYDKSKASKFIKRLNPAIHKELQGSTMKAGEVAAYAFQAFDQARREGRNVPGMGGPVRRFFNFLSQFFPRLKNSLAGRGFRSTQDVFRDASTGVTAEALAGKARPVSAAAPQASALVTTDTSVRGDANYGLLPFLRFKHDKKFDHTRKINQGVNPDNAQRQIDSLDELLDSHPNTLASEEAFADFLADAMGKDNKDGSVPMLPFRAIQMANNPDMIVEQIGGLTNGQRNMAEDGFQSAEKFRLAYEGGLAKPEHTGKLILWGILSRGVSPFVQESLFLDVVQERGNKAGIGKFISDAAEGNFNLKAYLKWVKSVIPEDSPGAGATHNLNAFGEMTLTKMSQRGSDGLTMLQKFHNLVSDQSLTGRQVRREFHKMNTGIGINNKVVSFMLLVSGRNDVMVLDRVQFRNLFNDGRLGSYNLYDGQKMKGPSGKSSTISGTSIQGLGDGTMGLMMYEALERDMMPAVREAYKKIGRGPDASMGRFHWESWVASSAQEVDHGTIDGIIHDAMGIEQPYNSITTKEGRYTQYKGGSVYGYKENGQPYLHIPDGLGNMYEFTPSQATTAFKRIAKGLKRDGIMPSKIKISENKGRPYYERTDINNEALGRVLKETGGRLVQPRVRGTGQGNTDGTRPDAQGTTQASAVLGVQAAARPQAIGQTGTMADLLATGNTEGVLAKTKERFTKYFKGGLWLDDLVNRFHILGELDKLSNKGVIGLATKSAMKMAELATNLSGRSEFALMHGNLTYNPKTGELGIDENSEGLLEIFKSIGAGDRYTNFQKYALARRAVTLKADTKRRVAALNIRLAAATDEKQKNSIKADIKRLNDRQANLDKMFTDQRIADGMRFEDAQFKDVFDRYNKFNQRTLQFLVDTGVISEKQKDGMNIDYIPYYKMMEEEEFGSTKKMVRNSVLGPRVTQVFNNPDAGIQELTGREGAIGDMYENIIKNNNAMISAGLKNVSMERALTTMETQKMVRKVTDREKNNPNVVAFYRGGQKTYMDLADEDGRITDFNHRVFMALSAFSPPQLTGLMDFVQKATGVFRNAITLAPNFMLANLIRGDIAGFVTVTEGQKPIFGTLKGFKNVLANDSVSEEMKAISGVGGYAYGQDTRDFASVFKRRLDPQTNVVAQLRKAIEGLQTVGEASELSTRDGIYRATLERTGSKTEAAYQALNLVNFNRRGNPQTRAGSVLSLLLPMVPFLNARIQGLYRTGTALSGKEANRAIAIKRMAMLGGVSTLIWMMSSGDDRWDDEPLYRKMNYEILYFGDTRILIPKAFEVGALAQTMPQVLLDVIAGDEGGKYVADAVAHTFLNTFSFNPIPQVIKPTLEVYTNYDFFRGRDIESARLRNLPKEQRADTTTPGVARGVGQLTSAVGISPVQLETLVRGHLGTLGVLTMNTMDTVLSAAGLMPAKPDGVMPGGDILGINRFIREGADPSNKWVGEVYDLRREANEVYNGIRALREDGQREAALELMKDNRSLLSVRKSVSKLAQSISKITKQINKVRNSETLSGSEKKDRLNTLINRRNQIAERVDRLLDRAGK